MIRFTLRQLEYAVAVAKHLNFGAAASACHVAQPSLSAQIAQLETALGFRLFERSSKRVRTTREGAEFVARAARSLEDLRAMDDAARAERAPLTGDLRLGVIPTVAPYLVPRLVEVMRRRHPACRLLLAEDQTKRLVRRAEDGDLDLLLLALEADLGRLASRPLFSDAFLAAMPADHALASRKSVELKELLQENFLLLEDGHCLADQILAACGAAESDAGDFRAGSLGTLAQMTALGHGVTLIPEMAAEVLCADARIAVRPLKIAPARTIGLAWREGHPRAEEFRLFGEAIAASPVATESPARLTRRARSGTLRSR